MLFRVVSEIVFLRGSIDIKHPMSWEAHWLLAEAVTLGV